MSGAVNVRGKRTITGLIRTMYKVKKLRMKCFIGDERV